jgi:curved DNA-binding protein CbpA
MNATKPYQTQNFYELLEVPPSASGEQILEAYYRALELYGPDSVAMYALDETVQVDELRARLEEAWKVLGDDALRGAYDESLGLAAATKAKKTMTLVAANGHPGSPEPEDDVEALVDPRPPAAALDSPSVASQFVEMAPPGDSAPSPALRDAGEKSLVRQPESSAARREETKEETKSAAKARLEIPPDAEFTGELLRRVREAKGLTLQQIAERTRISARHLENVEADNYGQLPAPVYLRGILMNLSKELRLDSLRVSKSYLDALARGKK